VGNDKFNAHDTAIAAQSPLQYHQHATTTVRGLESYFQTESQSSEVPQLASPRFGISQCITALLPGVVLLAGWSVTSYDANGLTAVRGHLLFQHPVIPASSLHRILPFRGDMENWRAAVRPVQ